MHKKMGMHVRAYLPYIHHSYPLCRLIFDGLVPTLAVVLLAVESVEEYNGMQTVSCVSE